MLVSPQARAGRGDERAPITNHAAGGALSAEAQAGCRGPDGGPDDARAAAPCGRCPDDALIILPVRNVVMFPGTVFPLTIGRQRSQAAVQEAVRLERPIGVLLQSKPELDEPGPDDLHWVGTSAAVLRYVTAPDGTHHAVAQRACAAFASLQFLEGYPFPVARVQYVEDPRDRRTPRSKAARVR